MVVPILLTLALVGILMEILTPGFGVPKILAWFRFLFFFGGRYLAGLAGWSLSFSSLAGATLFDCGVFPTWLWNSRNFRGWEH